ncbi:MAG: MBL fold metallo-hydrolase [Halioglobus sp.]|nr:MBL fold metallo-hydrolase [Halioglobus sp.]
MQDRPWQDLGHGITCIDAAYVERGMACFYLLEQDGEYALIESGTRHSLPGLLALLQERRIDPGQVRYVIPTHVHLDHAGGAGAMLAHFEQAQLLIHPRGARHMVDPAQLVAGAQAVYGAALFEELYGEVVPVDPARVRQMGDGEGVQLGGRRLEVRHTEGHARHHFCVWDERSRGWFTGDMFGVCYPWLRFPAGDFLLPSTTPTQFDPGAYLASLDLLHDYAPARMYLTHYGAVDYTREKSGLLARQVEAYRELALTTEGDLQQALADHALEQVKQYDASTPEADLRRWLRFDVELNAQGLALWRERERRA